MNRIDHITLTMDFTRACGPVTEAQIAAELRRQHNAETAERDARNAIDHGTQHGWLEAYDEESFCMA
jgi:hypothetical protein